jgi:hypothetical protein
MKQIETDKSFLDNFFGLSCVENYLLYVYDILGYDYRPLYAKSFLPIYEIATAFCDQEVSYAYFDKISRLQDIAKEQGLIRLTNVYDFWEGVDNYDYVCIRVTPDFVTQQYGQEFWRNDHFILLCKRNTDNWICLNDNPRDIFTIDDSDMPKIYADQSVCFNIFKTPNDTIKKNMFDVFREKIALPPKKYVFDFHNLIVARDMLGILRITRKRICKYCSLYLQMDFMTEYLHELDKAYVTLEYMRLRRNADFQKINQIFDNIQITDFEITAQLNERMERIR